MNSLATKLLAALICVSACTQPAIQRNDELGELLVSATNLISSIDQAWTAPDPMARVCARIVHDQAMALGMAIADADNVMALYAEGSRDARSRELVITQLERLQSAGQIAESSMRMLREDCGSAASLTETLLVEAFGVNVAAAAGRMLDAFGDSDRDRDVGPSETRPVVL